MQISIQISTNSTFLGSDKPRMLFFPLINVKMPTIVGILTFMSWKNFMLSWVEHEKSLITSGPDLLLWLVCLFGMVPLFKERICCLTPTEKGNKISTVACTVSTVHSRYLDFGYLEQPFISKKKPGPCLNLTSGNKILWIKGGAISPLSHNIFNIYF